MPFSCSTLVPFALFLFIGLQSSANAHEILFPAPFQINGHTENDKFSNFLNSRHLQRRACTPQRSVCCGLLKPNDTSIWDEANNRCKYGQQKLGLTAKGEKAQGSDCDRSCEEHNEWKHPCECMTKAQASDILQGTALGLGIACGGLVVGIALFAFCMVRNRRTRIKYESLREINDRELMNNNAYVSPVSQNTSQSVSQNPNDKKVGFFNSVPCFWCLAFLIFVCVANIGWMGALAIISGTSDYSYACGLDDYFNFLNNQDDAQLIYSRIF